MHIRYIKPSSVLSEFIKYYWVLETDNMDGVIHERVVPTGNIELMFHYKKSFTFQRNAEGPVNCQPQTFISGVDNQFSDICTRGESGVIAVTFYPLGAGNFFRFPLAEIENSSVSLDLVTHPGIKDISEKICEDISIDERIRIIECFLFKLLVPANTTDINMLQKGLAYINASHGKIDASHLASKLAVTPRNLERKFSYYVGKSPKQYIRIVRFQHILDCFSKKDDRTLTQLAFDYGYFDQAHFIKDFKSLTGISPKEFADNYPCVSDYLN